jgi:hypothetical protein
MRLLERMRGRKHEPTSSVPGLGLPAPPGMDAGVAEGDTFLMVVDDVFNIPGRGTVVSGRIARGVIRPGDQVELVGDHDRRVPAVVGGVERFRKLLDVAHAGDNVGVLLADVDRSEVRAGMTLVAAGSSATPPAAVVAVEVEDPHAAPEAKYPRYPGAGVCDVCNRDVQPNEAFQVPTAEFWASRGYKDRVAANPVTRGMLMMSGTSVDDFIAMQRRMDTTEYSAVCPDCIHLFP